MYTTWITISPPKCLQLLPTSTFCIFVPPLQAVLSVHKKNSHSSVFDTNTQCQLGIGHSGERHGLPTEITLSMCYDHAAEIMIVTHVFVCEKAL